MEAVTLAHKSDKATEIFNNIPKFTWDRIKPGPATSSEVQQNGDRPEPDDGQQVHRERRPQRNVYFGDGDDALESIDNVPADVIAILARKV
jgi:hypothetical protein